MTYLPPPYFQGDGSKYQWSNCTAATAVELMDQGTCGRVRITAWQIRNRTGDTAGGMEYSRVSGAVFSLTQVFLETKRYDDWEEVRHVLEHRSAGFIYDCSRTIRTRYRTNSFTGLHSGTAAGGTMKNATVKFEDPGTRSAGWYRMPLQLLRDAANIGGYYWLLVAPATEDVKKRARRAVAVRAEPDRNAKRLGGLAKGDEVHVRHTTKGGPWRRADGDITHGWHAINWKGQKAYVKGEGL